MSARIPPWKIVWRRSIAPQLSTRSLSALRIGLARDDRDIVQGDVVVGDGFDGTAPATAGCAIGYCGMAAQETKPSVAAVMGFYDDVCEQANVELEGRLTTRDFTEWFDRNPREAVFAALLAEVDRVLAKRKD